MSSDHLSNNNDPQCKFSKLSQIYRVYLTEYKSAIMYPTFKYTSSETNHCDTTINNEKSEYSNIIEENVLLSFERNLSKAWNDGWRISAGKLVPPNEIDILSCSCIWYKSKHDIFIPACFIKYYPIT